VDYKPKQSREDVDGRTGFAAPAVGEIPSVDGAGARLSMSRAAVALASGPLPAMGSAVFWNRDKFPWENTEYGRSPASTFGIHHRSGIALPQFSAKDRPRCRPG
jgi:hypothetical protein